MIDVNAQTRGLIRCSQSSIVNIGEEDEVRFIIHGHGLFHIRPKESRVVPIEVEAGDLILLPKGMWHWFDSAPIDRFARSVCSKTLRLDTLLYREWGRSKFPTDVLWTVVHCPSSRRTVTFNVSSSSVQGILLDIEGTTSPMDFVYQVLSHSRARASRIISDTMPTLKNCSAICRCCAKSM